MDIAKRIGENVRAARQRAGIPQEELAFLAGIHRVTPGLIERGERTPRVDTLAKLAGALDVSPAELMKGIVWEPAQMAGGGFAEEEAVEGEGRDG